MPLPIVGLGQDSQLALNCAGERQHEVRKSNSFSRVGKGEKDLAVQFADFGSMALHRLVVHRLRAFTHSGIRIRTRKRRGCSVKAGGQRRS